MQITKPRRYHEPTTYRLRVFDWRATPGAGFAFPVDASGAPVASNDDAARNLAACLSGEYDVRDLGNVEHIARGYTEPAEGRCPCGRTVILDGFTCPCDCGRDYNQSGQLLAPRSQWGEETGETAGDILRGGDPFGADDGGW